MIYTLPLRRTILHLAQRFRIDGETFMSTFLLANTIPGHYQMAKGLIIYFHSAFVQITRSPEGSWDSQDKRFSFGDSD